MACTNALGCSQGFSSHLDIEDIRINQDDKTELITAKNRAHYEKLVITMYNWIVTNTTKRHNIRSDFNKYFANITRLATKESGIYINKPLLIFVYRSLIEDGTLQSLPVV